jgi:DNA-binding transcriptional regulator YhcF (GntR family)
MPMDRVSFEDLTMRMGFTSVPNLILKSPKLTDDEKVTYMLLISYGWMNPETGERNPIKPSYNGMAEFFGKDRRTAIRRVQKLVKRGLVEIQHREKDGVNDNNHYIIKAITPKLIRELYPEELIRKYNLLGGSDTDVTRGGDTDVTRGSDTDVTRKNTNIQGKNEKEEKEDHASRDCQAKPDETDSKIQEVWSHWENHFRDLYPRMKLTDKRKKAIRARLRSFSVEELKTAIDNISKSPFHRGENEQGQPFAEIERNFRNDEKVEWWLAKKESSPNRRSRKQSAIENAIDETKTQEYLDYITKLEKEREARLAAKKKNKGEDAQCNTKPLPKFRLMSNSNKR